MSLQVWLPLNGNLKNQGLSNIEIKNNNVTVNDNGKIGKCYYFNASSYLYENTFNWSNFNTSEFSLCCWYKQPSPIASGNSQIICIGTSSGWNNIRIGLLRRTSNGYPMFSVSNGSTAVQYNCTATEFALDTWNHIACTYKNGAIKIYLNGILNKTYSTTITPTLNSSQHLGIGAASNGAEKLTGYLNDIRIYDHCLSQKEVEEIAKGLVLHYKLDQNIGTGTNLVKNGFGELGNQYWSAAGDTTDIPSGVSEIKASFPPCGNSYFIPISRNTQYKIECWIKATDTSGNTYPSLYPYDIDDNFIYNYNSKVGFNLNTMTTISQQLNPGDTKIYVTSLANWNANSGTNYNYAAIFGYADSTGYVYPDGVYTRNTPMFGSGTTAKINLDKTNNIITLNSAYNGPVVPIGTSICAATAGSTYFYPLGGIACNTIQDWTYKTGTFSSEDGRLLAAVKARFQIYSKSRMAGIKIINASLLESSNIIYDSSGYKNNGFQVDANSIIDTPKYLSSIALLGTTVDNSSNTIVGAQYLCGLLALPSSSNLTVTWWGKGVAYGRGGIFETTAANISTNGANGTDYNSTAIANWDTTFRIYNGSSSVNFYSNIPKTDNIWHHHAFTFNGINAIYYLDGELKQSGTLTGSLPAFNGFRMGLGRAGGVHRQIKQYVSDLRIYVTALTEAQIKELYQTSATIDDSGNVYSREYIENNNFNITKTGLFQIDKIYDNNSLNIASILKAKQVQGNTIYEY